MSSTFTPADVRRLALLARVELSADEIRLFADQLSGILAFAAEVQSVWTDGVALEAEPATPTPLREDAVRPSLTREEALDGASLADSRGGLFTVPRVFGE